MVVGTSGFPTMSKKSPSGFQIRWSFTKSRVSQDDGCRTTHPRTPRIAKKVKVSSRLSSFPLSGKEWTVNRPRSKKGTLVLLTPCACGLSLVSSLLNISHCLFENCCSPLDFTYRETDSPPDFYASTAQTLRLRPRKYPSLTLLLTTNQVPARTFFVEN